MPLFSSVVDKGDLSGHRDYTHVFFLENRILNESAYYIARLSVR